MDNKCPKCQKKIKFTYIKQDCPHCGADLLYYDMENRLEQDAVQAEKEFKWVEDHIDPILAKFKKFLKKVKKK